MSRISLVLTAAGVQHAPMWPVTWRYAAHQHAPMIDVCQRPTDRSRTRNARSEPRHSCTSALAPHQSARTQITMMLAREQGVVRQLKIQKVKTTGGEAKLQTLLELNREQTARLIDTVKLLDHIPIEGDDRTVVD